ncbi:hypothetical protein ACFO4O_07085 [Glaciecola siphonariae]|uniref:Lipoprotein n=1 Tax=Glaciecola siphonariae TaxID=521012 RepID=A0ABV9LTT0_9ALTE
MRKPSHSFVLLVSACALTACYNTSNQPTPDDTSAMVDARFVEQDASNVVAVQDAIAPLFNGQKIRLADDVFMKRSDVVLSSQNRLNNRGQAINDRDVPRIEDGKLVGSGQRFYLKKYEGRCALLHEQSDSLLWLSKNVRCE